MLRRAYQTIAGFKRGPTGTLKFQEMSSFETLAPLAPQDEALSCEAARSARLEACGHTATETISTATEVTGARGRVETRPYKGVAV